MSSRRSLLKTATALVAASLITPNLAYAEEPIPVVATFSILGDMVDRIGGAHVDLTTLVGPGGDSHIFQPTPQDAGAVANAKVLFMNGLELEGWLERLIEAAPFTGEIVVAAAGVDAIAFEEGGHDDHDEHMDAKDHDDHGHDDHDHAEAHDDHGHDDHDHAEAHDDHGHDDHDHAEAHDDHGHDDHAEHNHGQFDPHAWQTIENAIIYATNIASGLAKVDPANAADYYGNLAAYVAELQALGAEIDAMFAAIPEDRRIVVTSHDAFGYLAAKYDMTFKAPQGISTESEASAADVAALITQIREQSISAVFVESITDNRLIEQVANETGARIGGTLFTGALSDADGPAATYIDMMRHNAMTLSSALAE